MEGLQWLDWLSRVTHVSTAIVLVGGSVFSAFVLVPAAAELESAPHETLAVAITRRWKRFVHLGIVLFLASGFYNYFRAMPLHDGDGPYHALVGTKILLALAVFLIASALVGRSKAFAAMRRNRGLWLRILILLAAIIVALSGFVKVRGIPSANSSPAPTVSE